MFYIFNLSKRSASSIELKFSLDLVENNLTVEIIKAFNIFVQQVVSLNIFNCSFSGFAIIHF